MPDSPIRTSQHFDLWSFSILVFACVCSPLVLQAGVSLPGALWLCVPQEVCPSRMQLLINPCRSTTSGGAYPTQVAPSGFSGWVLCAWELFHHQPGPVSLFTKAFLLILQAATYACVCKGEEEIHCGALAGMEQPHLSPNFIFGNRWKMFEGWAGRGNSHKGDDSRGVSTNN